MAGSSFRAYKRRGGRMAKEPHKLKETIAKSLARSETLLCRNMDLYRDGEGRLTVRVLRFESLAADYEQLIT